MFKHILVATHGSDHADKAIALALISGKDKVTGLTIVHEHGRAEFAKAVFTN